MQLTFESEKIHKGNDHKLMRGQYQCEGKMKGLPVNFYEEMLMLESGVMSSLKSEDLEKLLRLYMQGIEYYERRDAKKLSGFQYRANWMLKQPEVMQMIKEMEEKPIKSREEDKMRKAIKERVCLRKRLNDESDLSSIKAECRKILQEISLRPTEDSLVIHDLLQSESAKQGNCFKEKLRLRKELNKARTSRSNAFDQKTPLNQPCSWLSSELLSTRTTQTSDTKRGSIDLSLKALSTIDSLQLNSKRSMSLTQIKAKLDDYLQSYNQYLYDKHYLTVVKAIKKEFERKYNEYMKISKAYMDQIKETQYELVSLDGLNREEIETIIASLNEEKEHELNKLNDKYEAKIKEHQAEFKSLAYKQKVFEVSRLKENVKVDIYHCMLDSL